MYTIAYSVSRSIDRDLRQVCQVFGLGSTRAKSRDTFVESSAYSLNDRVETNSKHFVTGIQARYGVDRTQLCMESEELANQLRPATDVLQRGNVTGTVELGLPVGLPISGRPMTSQSQVLSEAHTAVNTSHVIAI